MRQSDELTYEEAILSLRNKPEHATFIKDCYLDKNCYQAAERFAKSEEFAALQIVLKLKTQKKVLRILDAGCGNGIAAYAFAKLGHQVYAVDVNDSSEVGIGAARELNVYLQENPITIVKAFLENLPFEDGYFDIVYERQLLHHLENLEDGLKECRRVLKTAGLFFAAREHVVNDEEQLQEFLEQHPLQKLHGMEYAFSLNRYQQAFSSSGFSLKRVFAPFDTCINHYPLLNEELKNWLRKGLERRFGAKIAASLSNISIIEKLYRRKLSRMCTYPGRLYSFFCQKA